MQTRKRAGEKAHEGRGQFSCSYDPGSALLSAADDKEQGRG